MRSKRIGLPGLGARLRNARHGVGLTQEAVAGAIGVSWMTVHRWEHDQRTISEDKLGRLSELYGRPVRWFLTLDEADLNPDDAGYEVARRIYRRVAEAPRRYHTMLERVVDDVLAGLESSDLAKNSDG